MPGHDLTADRLAMRALIRQRACPHDAVEPVDLTTGQRVAWLCTDCDAQLPPGFSTLAAIREAAHG